MNIETNVRRELPFAYAIRLFVEDDGRVLVSCRDLIELRVALAEPKLGQILRTVEDAMDAIFQRYVQAGKTFPQPSLREPGEYLVSPSGTMIVQAVKSRSTNR